MSPATRSPRTRARRFAPVFAALGDETRLSLVGRLSDGQPRSITQLAEGMTLSRQAVTKHLRVLEDARLVRTAREGRERLFELDPEPMRDAASYMESVAAQWDAALGRLKAFVER